MVFRKLVDVQREKELAERRKDDPPLDVNTDLAVRKLLSRLQRRTTENHRLVRVASQAEVLANDDSTDEQQTGNGGIGSNSASNNMHAITAGKPSAKLQFAKLLRGTVASAATTSSTTAGGGTTPTMTTSTSTPPSRDGSPTSAGRPPSRAAAAAVKPSGF